MWKKSTVASFLFLVAILSCFNLSCAEKAEQIILIGKIEITPHSKALGIFHAKDFRLTNIPIHPYALKDYEKYDGKTVKIKAILEYLSPKPTNQLSGWWLTSIETIEIVE